MRRGPLIAVAAMGVALALAPAVFGMFGRAPMGARMIDDFRPFMRVERLDAFEGHLTTVGAALEALRRRDAGLDDPRIAPLDRRWRDIDADITGMLDVLRDNVDNFVAVDGLPDLRLFPWLFLLCGVLLAWLGAKGAGAARRSGTLSPRLRWAPAGLGLALVLVPAVFGMFSHAPLAAAMVDDLRPLTTPSRTATLRDAFVAFRDAEAALRADVLAEVEDADAPLPEVHALIDAWPRITADLAPFVEALSDNVDNVAAIAALPPLDLLPWLFAIPGVLVVGLALLASVRAEEDDEAVASRRQEPRQHEVSA